MTPTARPPFKPHASSFLFRAAQALRTTLDRELDPLGLTGQQAAMILLCAVRHGESFDSLAGELGTDSAGITRLADRLEAKGLISRQASISDRRVAHLVLTQQGREILPALRRSMERWRTRAFAGISDADLAKLETILQHVLHNAELTPGAQP